MKKVTIQLDEQTYQQFRLATVVNGTSMTEVLRDAVTAYLAEHGPQQKGAEQ